MLTLTRAFSKSVLLLKSAISFPVYEPVPQDDIEGSHASKSSDPPRRGRVYCLLCLALGCIAGAIIASCSIARSRHRRHYNPVGLYQDINSFPIVSNSKPESRAIVTSLYTDEYALSVATLGQTLSSHNIIERRLVMYLPGRLSSRSLCIVAAAGWEPVPVARIPAPHHGEGITPRFMETYAKLNMWGFDKMGIDVLLYLDGDTLVRNRFDELWDLPYSFAAVPDVYGGEPSFTISLNSGVLLVRPSSAVMEDMLSKLETTSFPRIEGDQAFLNTYFAPQTLCLPYIYNGNLAIKLVAPDSDVWASIKNELRIVHYTSTVIKPFWYLSDGVEWSRNWNQSIHKLMEGEKGELREEMQWWSDAWDDLMEQHFTSLDACS
ncbi:glycosyltransferase family 8 protein [Mycena pura]|uniref:Glycosyltransferase family 8 protein n=1 Tax=Mycena pura TaxID=153505 RepID=A0AAD6V006_9AGAR|nr:glycosyltransferase family 8 protein [Mycena pura]